MQAKIAKTDAEIEKLKQKILTYQSRLRELERQKTELENAEIIAQVRSINIEPNELAFFIKTLQEQQKNNPINQPTKSEFPASQSDVPHFTGDRSSENQGNYEKSYSEEEKNIET